MGIGSETATPIAAALIWAFRGGLGMIVGLLFGGAKSTAFKGYVLQYRLFADVMNDLGMIVDIALPFCDPKYYNAGYAISTSCKAICGVAAGATRGSILMSFTNGRDTSEITSKESAQETAITVVGILCGVVVGGWVEEWRFAWFAFWTAVHVWANFHAVKSVKFKTLNFPRLRAIINEEGGIVGPMEVEESVFCFWDMLRGSKVDLGCSLADLGKLEVGDVKGRKYVIVRKNGRKKVAISADASSEDVLDAATEALGGRKPRKDWAKRLADAGWRIDEFHFVVGDWRYKVEDNR
ncbi:hypothetical protein TrST_g7108 [Triparma strigata]|uniref:Protein root UVB sensitive/RUS domain-containing protein n=1 Tax=Triparma strigata TaxID=1606541 RepID=A0A9W7AQV7_9STRA|nr:hypothetical protein TrST_g7108 [Triparma strigata]